MILRLSPLLCAALLIACGAGAGIAASFQAPLAGAMFAEPIQPFAGAGILNSRGQWKAAQMLDLQFREGAPLPRLDCPEKPGHETAVEQGA